MIIIEFVFAEIQFSITGHSFHRNKNTQFWSQLTLLKYKIPSIIHDPILLTHFNLTFTFDTTWRRVWYFYIFRGMKANSGLKLVTFWGAVLKNWFWKNFLKKSILIVDFSFGFLNDFWKEVFEISINHGMHLLEQVESCLSQYWDQSIFMKSFKTFINVTYRCFI